MADRWDIDSGNVINYSQDIGRDAWQKAIGTFAQIFQYLNILRGGNATAGLPTKNTLAYETAINTNDNGIYMRDGKDADWILLGYIAPFMGITPEFIGAVKNGGGFEKISVGREENLPETNNGLYDVYITWDTCRWFMWYGSDWHVIFSKNFKDLEGYEEYVVYRGEVAENGKGKIPRLNIEDGKGHFDITGSAERILNRCINLQATMHDDDVLVYDARTDNWTTRKRTEGAFTEDDITYSGEAGKIPKISSDGFLHANLDGGTTRLLNIPIDATNLKDGQTFAYDALHNKFVPANVSGDTNKLGKVEIDLTNLKDGDVLVYKAASAKFEVEPKGDVTGEGKMLIIRNGAEIIGEYNGSSTVDFDLSQAGAGGLPIDGGEINGNLAVTGDLTVAGDINGKATYAGRADAAAKLVESVKINGVSFDGTKDITITAVANAANAANAGKADKLTTARKINGVEFDGTKDIEIELDTSNFLMKSEFWVS